jgi:patatin-like phospholipase/acyl hydrolase
MASKFRILSLDGGGLRGIMLVLVLKEIERRTGKRITDLFDLVAGTSTGGLITCGLTVSDDGITPRYSLEDLENVYVEHGKDIFPQKSAFKTFLSKISSLKNPKFSASGLQNVLTALLGEKRLSDCIKPVLVTTYDLFNNEAVLFKYRHAINFPENNALLVDVCRATSAAPTYLPAYDFVYENKKRICVDGGLYMNNPSMAALVEVIKYHREAPYHLPELKLNDVSILSIGTGHYTSRIARKKIEGWGLLDWAPNITDVMMQAINQTTTYQAEELTADGNFLRINPGLDNPDYSDMADSSDAARNYFINTVNKDIIGNAVLMKKLDAFLENNAAGVIA